MKIGIVGVGYVGLSTGASLAKAFDVVGFDIDEARVSRLNKGHTPIHEDGLNELLKDGLSNGRLSFTHDVNDLADCDFIFLSVGTPGLQDGSLDLSQMKSASASIGGLIRNLDKKPIVVVKSTVLPGTAATVVKPILEAESEKHCGIGFGLCSNPEFLREGSAVADMLNPDRIIVAGFDEASTRKLLALYRKFYAGKRVRILVTSPESAELIKYASNAFLATKISFINLIARLCEGLPGTDVNEIAMAMGLDPRIGPRFLNAGPGFGGSCFSKDLLALSKFVARLGHDTSLLDSVLAVNERQPTHVLSMAEKQAGFLRGKEVAVLGLAFKAQSDDIRDSRSMALVRKLLKEGAKVRVYDPLAMDPAAKELGTTVAYSKSARKCITGADLAMVMTDSAEFKRLTPKDFTKLMRSPAIVDARRIYDPAVFSDVKFSAVGLGRSPSSSSQAERSPFSQS